MKQWFHAPVYRSVRLIPERRETNKVSPAMALACCLECPGYEAEKKNTEFGCHIELKRQRLQFGKARAAAGCRGKQQKWTRQRESSANLQDSYFKTLVEH